MSTLFRLLEPIRMMPLRAVSISLIFVIGFLLINIFVPYATSMIITSLEHQRDYRRRIYLLIGLYSINFFRNIANRIFVTRYRRSIQIKVYDKYIPRFFHLSPTVIEQYGTGKLMSVIIKGIDTRSIFSERMIRHCLLLLLNIIFTAVSIRVFIDWRLGIVAMIFAIITIVISLRGTHLVKPLRKKLKHIFDEANRYYTLWFMSKQEILQHNKIGHELERNRRLAIDTIRLGQRINITQIFFLDASRLLFMIIVVVGIIRIAGLYQAGGISLGSIVLFSSYLGRMRGDNQDIIQFFEDYNEQIIQIEKMRDFFDSTPKIKNLHSSKLFKFHKGDIQLQHITFGYQIEKLVLSDFSLSFKAGTKTALVGPSGGGKTTIMKLIAGILEPQFGTLIVDNQNILETNPLSYYLAIGYLSQDPSVFDGTVRDNLMYGIDNKGKKILDLSNDSNNTNGNIKNISLQDILEKSQCQFVYDLPNGLDTEIGERGVRLSGGQKQRLAIAKIMLKNPKIILLDEPTSALDSFNEELVSKALHKLFEGRTVIVIAHRLQTVKQADRILYIEHTTHDEGSTATIAEEGTHDQLVALGGKYKKMLDLQSGF